MDPALAAAVATVSGGVLAVLLAVAAYINAKARAVADQLDGREDRDP